MLHKLVFLLEDEVRAIETGAFDCPPEDYAKFREAVGKRNGLLKAIDMIHELSKDRDE